MSSEVAMVMRFFPYIFSCSHDELEMLNRIKDFKHPTHFPELNMYTNVTTIMG